MVLGGLAILRVGEEGRLQYTTSSQEPSARTPRTSIRTSMVSTVKRKSTRRWLSPFRRCDAEILQTSMPVVAVRPSTSTSPHYLYPKPPTLPLGQRSASASTEPIPGPRVITILCRAIQNSIATRRKTPRQGLSSTTVPHHKRDVPEKNNLLALVQLSAPYPRSVLGAQDPAVRVYRFLIL